VIFVTDENFPIQAARMLEAFDSHNEIRPLLDHAERGTPDSEWIAMLGAWESKPVVVSGDGRILKNRVERRALREANLTFVFLASGWMNLPWNDFAWKIVRSWPAIVDNVRHAREPTLFEVKAGKGKVERLSLLREL